MGLEPLPPGAPPDPAGGDGSRSFAADFTAFLARFGQERPESGIGHPFETKQLFFDP